MRVVRIMLFKILRVIGDLVLLMFVLCLAFFMFLCRDPEGRIELLLVIIAILAARFSVPVTEKLKEMNVKVGAVLAAVTGIVLCVNIFGLLVAKRDWIITTAEDAEMWLPDGIVAGTYTDNGGVLHEKEYLYHDSFLWFFGLDKLIEGKKIWIMYDPTGEGGAVNLVYQIVSVAVSLLVFISAVAYLNVCYRRKQGSMNFKSS